MAQSVDTFSDPVSHCGFRCEDQPDGTPDWDTFHLEYGRLAAPDLAHLQDLGAPKHLLRRLAEGVDLTVTAYGKKLRQPVVLDLDDTPDAEFDRLFPEPMPARQGELKLAAAQHRDVPPGTALVYTGPVPDSIVDEVAAEILDNSHRQRAEATCFATFERASVRALFFCAKCEHALHSILYAGAAPDGDTRLCLNPDCANYEKRLLIAPQPTHYLVCDGPASAYPRGASF